MRPGKMDKINRVEDRLKVELEVLSRIRNQHQDEINRHAPTFGLEAGLQQSLNRKLAEGRVEGMTMGLTALESLISIIEEYDHEDSKVKLFTWNDFHTDLDVAAARFLDKHMKPGENMKTMRDFSLLEFMTWVSEQRDNGKHN